MAEERVIKIVGNTSDADKKVNKLTDDVEKLGVATEQTNNKIAKGFSNTDKSTKKAKKSVGSLSKGFKRLGLAIKASGIGLIVSLIATMGFAFSKNQKFIDGFSVVTETLGIILSQVATALITVYETVSKSSENFDALGRVVKGLINLAFTPLKLTFFGIKLAIKESQLAWENSFFGGKDKEKSKQLRLDITETKNSIKQIGEEAVKSGIDVVVSFGEAVEEVTAISKLTAIELNKISIQNAIETAKTNVQIKNTAKLAVAQQQLLVEKYDILAEKQRQIRDEERNSIDERIIANNKLSKVLQMQEKAMLATAAAQIAAARVELDKNNTIENQVALTEALANKQGVLAQVEGFRSEQLVNDLALKREQIELDNSIADNEKERRLKQLEFDESQEQNELAKLDRQKERLDLENEIILQDLERKRELFKEGTQARIDAENEYILRKQEIDNSIIENDRLTAEEQIKIQENLEQAKANVFSSGLDLIASLAGKSKTIAQSILLIQKGLAISEVVTSASKAIAKATSNLAATPAVIGVAPNPAYAAQAAATAKGIATTKLSAGASIASILAQTVTSLNSGSLGSQNSGGNQNVSAPSFSLVQGTGSNQVAQSVQNNNQQPIQAYVVGSNVTNQQDLDRQRIANSSI